MRICFVAPTLYPMLSGDYSVGTLGGAELQQVQLAETLRDKGHQVSVVCRTPATNCDPVRGINVFSMGTLARRRRGWPTRNLWGLFAALKSAAAELYYTRTASRIPGYLRIYCSAFSARYVFSAGLDTDFDLPRSATAHGRERLLFAFGVRGADLILVQNDRQRRDLERNFGREGVLMRNFLREPAAVTSGPRQRRVLWVATIRARKRPELVLSLAEKCPELEFVMIGGPAPEDPELFHLIRSKAARLPNVSFLGQQSYTDTDAQFADCILFLNTSETEGFPNTFLQAWRRGVPVVSLLDPDGVIRRHGLGTVVDDVSQLADAVRVIVARQDEDSEVAPRIARYFSTAHGPGIAEKASQILESCVQKTGRV